MVRRKGGNVIDVDLRPERRERLAEELRAADGLFCAGSQGGELASARRFRRTR